MKLNPGDLMFETGADNGRYLGIYHVEMFTGYVVAYYGSDGKPVLYETWGARPDGYYGGGYMIYRPYKWSWKCEFCRILSEFVKYIEKMLKKNKEIGKIPYIGIAKCGKNIYNAKGARK